MFWLRHIKRALGVLGALALGGCAGNPQPLRFDLSQDELVLTGIVDAAALKAFEAALAAHPDVKTLVLLSVPGSLDDDANLELARRVRAAGLNTRIPSEGVVASGGTDLFLAGATRRIAPQACLGVHSWGDALTTGADVPRDDPVHAAYLAYYREMDVPGAFYWYTLSAAGVDDTHWMTPTEISRFNITADSPVSVGSAETCDVRLEEALH